MKLNPDCIRDVMLYLETNLKPNDLIYSSKIDLPKYTQEDIDYSIIQLLDARFLKGKHQVHIVGSVIYVNSLTYSGHEFLDTIRDNDVWSAVKTVISKSASFGISVLSSTAKTVFSQKFSGASM